jgi:hypothetical protein
MQVADEDWYIRKYGDEKGKQVWIDKCSSSNLLENWTKKHGKEMADEMYIEYKAKLSKSRSLEGYIEKHGEELGTKKWNAWVSIQGRSEDFYIDLHGEELGKEKYKKIIDNRKYYSSLEGMIERYGLIEGTKRYNKWYSATKKGKVYYINKFGPEEGLIYWENLNNRRVETWKKSVTLEGFQAKYGDELGKEKWQSWRIYTGNYSQKSFNFFSKLIESYPEFKDAHFGDNEQFINLQDVDASKTYAKPDFLWNDKIIEFNGVYWHKDPRFFDDSISHQNTRRKDFERTQALEKKGYSVKVVWETDYDNNPLNILLECVEFLKKNVK